MANDKNIKRYFLGGIIICTVLVVGLASVEAETDLDSAAQLYQDKCASCHGVSATSRFPHRDEFTSVTKMNDIYGDIGAHGNVNSCDENCINDTNTYIWQVLWEMGSCTDNDSDDYYAEEGCGSQQVDCNDNNADINPGMPEVSGDNIDNDCDGTVDETEENNPEEEVAIENTGCFINSLR